MRKKEDVKNKYEEVEKILDNAIKNSNLINLVGKDENIELERIKQYLSNTNDDFKKQIEELEKSSEWDKFCIAFFGETNAGKSTIIESLRILYNEEERRKKLIDSQNEYIDELKDHIDNYKPIIDELKDFKLAIVKKVKEDEENDLRNKEEINRLNSNIEELEDINLKCEEESKGLKNQIKEIEDDNLKYKKEIEKKKIQLVIFSIVAFIIGCVMSIIIYNLIK